MIFQCGHSVKAVKEIALFLNIGYTTAKKRPKIFVIIIKTKNRIEYHKNDVEMQEMPLERHQNLQNFMVSWGTIPPEPRPLEACALRTCVSAFMVLKNIFLSFKRGWNLCTCNWARDVKKYLNYNQKHFDCPPLPG